MRRWTIAGLTAAVTALAAGAGWAAQPEPWQLGFQPAASPVMEQTDWMHNFLLIVIVAITVFVMALLAYVMVRYREKANPNPEKWTHNTLIEVIWTGVPVLILVAIAIPSFQLLYFSDKAVNADFTLRATASQFLWTYEYPDHDNVEIISVMKQEDELLPGEPRLLAVDNNVVVPVGATVRLLVTSADVLHAFALPAFGVKKDAVPGRLNETWFQATREGMFYGQCSEICGAGHAYMPIAIEVVSQDRFDAWISQQIALKNDNDATQVAAAAAQ